MEEGDGGNTGSPVGGAHTPTGTPRGAGRAGRVADGLVVPRKPGNAGGGKEPWFESDAQRGEGMTTGESLPGSGKVRRLRSVLHAKAKEEPSRRFHALIDKVWREDFLAEAWRRVRRNGGAAGVDGETFAAIESYGVGRWLGELARERKTRCLRCPEEAFEFLGYRIGRIHRPTGKGSYTGTRPTKASVQSICRKVSEMTTPRYGPQSPETMVERLNRTITGWANYFSLGTRQPGLQRGQSARGQAATPVAVPKAQGEVRRGRALPGREAARRLRPRSPDAAGNGAFRARRHDLVRKPDAGNPHVRFDERGLETWPWEPD